MNISALREVIDLFNEEIVSSGLKRDIQDYLNSLGNNQNNIVALRDMSNKILVRLESIYANDLPEALNKLFVGKIKPFTNHPHHLGLSALIEDPEIPLATYYQKLSQILSDLNNQIQQNVTEISRISEFINPYIEKQTILQSKDQKAIVSIIFKDNKTISKFKELVKVLQAWNRILPLYHQILKSSSPEDIEIVTVENGSIDILINIDFDIAIELAEVFKIGFECFMAYLSYKKLLKPIIQSYHGNAKLIAGEKEREEELINNIGDAIRNLIIEQHKKSFRDDKNIEQNIDKKLDQVVKLVTSHILKGNDIKILALPDRDEKEKTDNNGISQKGDLRTISSNVRQAMKIIPPEEIKVLLEKYNDPEG